MFRWNLTNSQSNLHSSRISWWNPARHRQTSWWTPGPDWPVPLGKKVLSLPAFLRLVGLLLLPLPLSSHLLQLLPVFPLDEALLMGHLWEVIWSSERQGGKPSGVDQGEQIQRETEETKSSSSQDTTPTLIIIIMLRRHFGQMSSVISCDEAPGDWTGLVWCQSSDEEI